MRIAFFGTPDFAVPALEALIAPGHTVVRVYSQPAKPSGRGLAERPTPVARAAIARGLLVETPRTLKDKPTQASFASLGLDAAIVVAYGLLLPKPILDAPRLGCLNIHASLLPRWRGAAPIQRALLAGDVKTGVTIMRMDEGLDTGPMLLSEATEIGPKDDAGSLHDRLSAIGASLIVQTLARLETGSLEARPQPKDGVTLAPKIRPEEARIDWRDPASALARRVRAFAPAPGAYFMLGKQRIKLLAAEAGAGQGPAGTVLDSAPTVACGEGALRLLALQREGKRPLPAAEFLRGTKLAPGSTLG